MKRTLVSTLSLLLGVTLLASCSSNRALFLGNLPGVPLPPGFARAFIGECNQGSGKVHIFAPTFSAISFPETGAFGPPDCGYALSINPANGMLARTSVDFSGLNGPLNIYNPPYSSATTPTVALSAELANPVGVAWDASGNVWTADPGHASVDEFSPPFSADEQPAAMNLHVGAEPTGLAINPSAGLMFVGDLGPGIDEPCDGTSSCHVYVVPAPYTGVPTATFTFGTSTPTALAVDQLGRLFVGFGRGTFGGLIKVYLPPFATGNTAAYTLTVGSPVENLAFDSAQNLYAQEYDSRTAVFSGPILGSAAAPWFFIRCPVECGQRAWGGIAFGP